MKKSSLAIAIATSLFSYVSNSYAESDNSQTSDDTVVVTANRFEQKVDSTTAPVVVVTKTEIERIQATDLVDVLKRLPGIQVVNNGSYGQSSSIYVRGTSASHLLVLIDGVRFGSATSGSADMSNIPLVSVERIEYIRGPRAALYGADAMGGVINIITDNSNKETSLSAKYGSDNYRETKLMTAGDLIKDKLHASVGYQFTDIDGYTVQDADTSNDDDGYIQRAVTATINYKLSNDLNFNLLSFYKSGMTEYDTGNSYNKSRAYNIAGKLNYEHHDFKSALTLAQNSDQLHYPLYGSAIQTVRQEASFDNTYTFNDLFDLGGGIEWYEDDISKSTSSFDETSRYNVGVYLTSLLHLGELEVESAIRNDDNQRYSSHTTWNVGVGYWLTDNYRVTTSVGTAFHAPTFNQLYYPKYGNPDLSPETSRNYEIGLTASYDPVELGVSAYRNKIHNYIFSNKSTSYIAKQYDDVTIDGVELTAKFDTGIFNHSISYDYTDTYDNYSHKELPRRSLHSAKWNTSFDIDSFSFDVSYLYQGSRFDDDTNENALGAYSLVDFMGTYTFDNGISVQAKVANAFDADYETASGYITPDRKYYLTLNYKI